MDKYQLSLLAKNDLIDIFQTSIDRWGANKAEQYANEIEAMLVKLSSSPNIGKCRDELFPGALSFPVGSHVVFYQKGEQINNIKVARILHQNMDFYRHFNAF